MDFTLITLAAVVIILALDVWAIVSVMRSTKTSATKLGWAAVILVMPLVGLAIWGIAGPRGVAIAPTSSEHSKG